MEDRDFLEAELRRMREQRDQMHLENQRLRRENERLQARLHPSDTDGAIAVQLHLPDPDSSDDPVTSASSATEKIGLFKRLFRGRQDVYAVRWERSDGRAGYAPASRSSIDRERGVFLPLTDEVVHDHLAGRQIIGVYPLLRGETCWLLSADFDKEHWQEDVTAKSKTLTCLLGPRKVFKVLCAALLPVLQRVCGSRSHGPASWARAPLVVE